MLQKKKKRKLGWRGNLLLVASVMTAIVFLPTSFMLFIGMMPTLVIFALDKSKGKMKTITIGVMNFAGCLPFIMELWAHGHNFTDAVTYISEPRTIVVMYFSAAIGHMIEWAVISIVTSIIVERSKERIKEIQKIHKEMEKRWGEEVSGRLPIDSYGFPIHAEKIEEA